jgi:cell division transport system permease protein
MNTLTLKRIVRASFLSLRRVRTVSVSAIIMMVMALSVIAVLIFTEATLYRALTATEQKVDVTVYFTTDAAERDILQVSDTLKQLPEVASVTYTSADDALTAFRARHADDYLTLQALDELKDNPLGATLAISAKDPGQYESIANFLDTDTGALVRGERIIDKVNYQQNKEVITRLRTIIAGARTAGSVLALVFGFIAILMTYTTIRLAVFSARHEISVMRLVGAARSYVQGPFIAEGILYGIFAWLITLVLLVPFTIWAGTHLTDFLGVDLFSYYMSSFFQIAGILLLIGTLIGALSAWIAVRGHLKK